MPSAGLGTGTGAGGVRTTQRTTVSSPLVVSPRTGAVSTLRTVEGGTVSNPRTSSTATTSALDLTRDGKPSHDDPKPLPWPQTRSTTSAESSSRPSTSSLPIENSTRLSSPLSPTSPKISKVTLSYKEPSATPSSRSLTATLPAAPTPQAASSLQTGQQRERVSIPTSKRAQAASSLQTGQQRERVSMPTSKRARSPSPSLSASSSSTSAKRRIIEDPEDYIEEPEDSTEEPEDYFDIDVDEDRDSTTSSTTARSSSRLGAYPCEWVKRRKNFIKPFILEAAQCQLGFDTEVELFSHYAWHIDQLEIDDECPVTTCRMKILSDEHLKMHYQKMHPDLPVPFRAATSSSTAATSKSTGRTAAMATVTARTGRASHSPSELPVNPARTRTITPTPPPQQNATPSPSTPTKSRSHSKLQQTRILSEGDKAKMTANETTPPTTAANNNNATFNQSNNKTKARLTTAIHSNDDDDEDNIRPMALGFFFRKRS
ncbi:hypothetical protein K457DRAFT_164082 [Linnemannia elongata AG-77]|uniref:Uncharacterized protein n=1 Tax=Linnemannia elongata AG-77 TaxID=1314771 RepID=A0A197KH16_9FUNG|nr:hypothetical protein K457DRAFT_164082 [Linnemannia elongata AG-77]